MLIVHLINLSANTNYASALLYVTSLVICSILAVGKDLYKKNSILAASVLVACKVLILVLIIINSSSFGTSILGFVIDGITNVLLAGNVLFMISGKYYDKEQRGIK